MSVFWFDDLECNRHASDYNKSPEVYERTLAIRNALMNDERFKRIVNQKEATNEEIQSVHTSTLMRKIERGCAFGQVSFRREPLYLSDLSLLAAKRAAGCVLFATDYVLSKEDKIFAFCNVRPPGHHANREQSRGFCVFNNVAIAVTHALKHPRVNKIAIVDWDVHHGDGTESIFRDAKDVFYASLYKTPLYPDASPLRYKSSSLGLYPFLQSYTSKDYLSLFDEMILDVQEFNPDLIFISCGFDAHKNDPLGRFCLETDDYRIITKKVVSLGRPVISVLEGGYDTDVLGECAIAHLEGFL